MVTIDDGIRLDSDGRYVLDSYDKVLNYILTISREDEINLSNCVLKSNSEFQNFKFDEFCDFASKNCDCSILGIISSGSDKAQYFISKRLICENSILENVFFSNIIFNNYVGFDKSRIVKSHFNNSQFQKGLSFAEANIENYISFKQCSIDNLFLHNISFMGSMFDLTMTSIKSVSIMSSTFVYDMDTLTEFEEKPNLITFDLNFACARIGEIFISKSKTNMSVSFMGANIKGKVTIIDTDFSKGLIFDDSYLEGPQLALETKEIPKSISKGFISFDRAKINTDVVINRMALNCVSGSGITIQSNGRVCIYSSKINDIMMPRASIYGELSILHLKSDTTLSLTYAINLGVINITIEHLKIFDSDTAKILRLASQKLNNSIEVSTLKAIEHKLFLKEYKFKPTLSFISEYILLFLNNISNQFETDWIRGILFCIVVSIISVSIIGLSINEYTFTLKASEWVILSDDFWRKSLEFLWLPNLDNFQNLSSNSNCKALTICSYIIGKSLVAYGIFQTISAFRRYSK